MGSSINHTVALNLKNKGNANVGRGDSVIVDRANNAAFTLTGSAAFSDSTIGVVLDSVGITTGSSGMVAIEGYVPQINLVSGSNTGDYFYLSSVQQKAHPHAGKLTGDFGQTLGAGTTPDAILWGSIVYAPAVTLPTWQNASMNWKVGGSTVSPVAGIQRYLHYGYMVILQVAWTINSGGPYSGTFVVDNLPKPIANSSSFSTGMAIGYGRYENQGTAFYDLAIYPTSSTSLRFQQLNAFTDFSSGAENDSDALSFTLTYESTLSS